MGNNESVPGKPAKESGEDTRNEYLWKIVVVGDSATGKTALIKRFVHDMFTHKYLATDVVDFSLKTILNERDNSILRLQVWDISGRERNGNKTRVYYEHAVGALVVCDCSTPNSLANSLSEAELWITDIRHKVSLDKDIPLPAVLLANKVDLVPEDQVDEVKRRVDDFAIRNKFAACFLVSAKDRTKVSEGFKALLGCVLNLRGEAAFLAQTKIHQPAKIESPT